MCIVAVGRAHKNKQEKRFRGRNELTSEERMLGSKRVSRLWKR